MRKLLLATRNKGKFEAFKRALKDFPIKLLSLDEVKSIPRHFIVKEKGKSFKENAVLKAKTFASISGLLTLADDSGLEVAALDGRPGIYSSRYGLGTDQDKYRKLLEEIKNVPDNQREAQFRCLLAIYDPQSKKLEIYEGTCQGQITRQPRGHFGFGYDPVFYLPQFGKTMAQLAPEEKNKISHRGQALKKLKKDLKKFL